MIYQLKFSWWRHQTEAFSTLLALCEGNIPVTGRFPSQRPVTRSFAVFFDLRLNKRLSKQSRRLWFEAPSRLLWHHCKVINVTGQYTGSGHFAPKDRCSANIWEKIPIFFPKFIESFYFYDIIYLTAQRSLYKKIRSVLGHESISESCIHWLLRYEPGFLGRASCPMLP